MSERWSSLVRFLGGPVGGDVDRASVVRRAVACALAIPVALFVGDEVIGGSQVAVFAVFGGFAVLLYARFTGDRREQARRYVALAVAGAAFISLGTVVAEPTWLAVMAMLVVGSGVLLAGVVSAPLAGSGRAVLLTFILPVAIRADVSVIPDRLLGWAVAFVVCAPVAVLLAPVQDAGALRRQVSRVAASAARVLAAVRSDAPERSSLAAELRSELTQLRTSFDATATRPVGVDTRSRTLIRAVDQLEAVEGLLARLVRRGAVQDETLAAQRSALAAQHVLEVCADVVVATGRRDIEAKVARLRLAVTSLSSAARADLDAVLAARAGGVLPPEVEEVELASVVGLLGRTVAAAETDRGFGRGLRTRWRSTGARPDDRAAGDVARRHDIVLSYVRARSVWFRNSLRAGFALSLSVLAADVVPLQHSFWIVLATLSALSSNAVGTVTTAARAALGTVIGFAVGATLVIVLGTGPLTLWLLLPCVIFLACFAPSAISFTSGQAAFTMVCIVLFDILHPSGWTVGVARLEDVLLGSSVALVVAVTVWPRGAAAVVERAASHAYRSSLQYLSQAVHTVTRGAVLGDHEVERVSSAARLLDDALRQYGAEMHSDPVRLAALHRAERTAASFRLAADEVLSLGPEPVGQHVALPRSRQALDVELGRFVQRHVGATGRCARPRDRAIDVAAVVRAESAGSSPTGGAAARVLWAWIQLWELDHQTLRPPGSWRSTLSA